MSDGLTINGPRNPIVPPPDGETPITLYGYIPSLALGIVAVVAFALVVIPNFWYVFRQKRRYWTFHICMIIGSLVEIAGYGARIHSHYNPFRVDNFVVQFLCIILVRPVPPLLTSWRTNLGFGWKVTLLIMSW